MGYDCGGGFCEFKKKLGENPELSIIWESHSHANDISVNNWESGEIPGGAVVKLAIVATGTKTRLAGFELASGS